MFRRNVGAPGSPPPITQAVNAKTYNYVHDDVGNRETSQVDVSPNQMVTT